MHRNPTMVVEPRAAVAALDAFLNVRIVNGPPLHQRRWWQVKRAAKIYLATLPPAAVSHEAAKILQGIIGGAE